MEGSRGYNRTYYGDVLTVLPELIEAGIKVNCVVTSPPYWGLRRYLQDNDPLKEFELGSEPTVENYIKNMVEVFRLVRELLTDDGTLWLNLGSTYAGSGGAGGDYNEGGLKEGQPKFPGSRKQTSVSSRLGQSAVACGTDDTIQSNSQEIGPAFRRSCGGHPASLSSHNSHTDLMHSEDAEHLYMKDHDMSPLGSVQASLGAFVPDVQASTNPFETDYVQDAFCPSTRASVSPEKVRPSSFDAPLSVDMSAYTSDTIQSGNPLSLRKKDKQSLDLAFITSQQKDPVALTFLYSAIRHLNLQAKNLIQIPHLVAFALQADGWILRSEIIWAKPNPMPASVTDRPVVAHETIFLLSKKPKYFYDAEAVKEKGVIPAGTLAAKGSVERFLMPGVNSRPPEYKEYSGTRNLRTVWTIATAPYPGSHFATFPPKLIEPCIKAGCPAGGIVLDPFLGSGTTAQVAESLGRRWIGCELNEAYKPLIDERTAQIGLGF